MSKAQARRRPVDVSGLFSPFRLRSIVLENRFVLPAMQRRWATDGKPDRRMLDHYRACVDGGVALVTSEACAVDHPGATFNPQACHMREATGDAWSTCIDAVHASGGHMFIQLWHEGADHGEPGSGVHARSAAELDEVKNAFVRSALVAERIGADGVEVHAAHGYLLDQFLWKKTNRRPNRYGGEDMRDRVRFPAEIVAAIREAVSPRLVISFRFSQWKIGDYDASVVDTPSELGVMLGALREAGVDVFHASTRLFCESVWPESDLSLAGWTRSITDAPVIAVGGIGLTADTHDDIERNTDLRSTGEDGLRELVRRFDLGEFDLVSVGRSLIADPEWVCKIREGRYAEVRGFEPRHIQ